MNAGFGERAGSRTQNLLIKSQGNLDGVLFRIPFLNQALTQNYARMEALLTGSKKARFGAYRPEAYGTFMAQVWGEPFR